MRVIGILYTKMLQSFDFSILDTGISPPCSPIYWPRDYS